MGTKNNPANRGKGSQSKQYDGKIVKPVKYIGNHAGHGNYIAAQYEGGQMATDNDGKPLTWDSI